MAFFSCGADNESSRERKRSREMKDLAIVAFCVVGGYVLHDMYIVFSKFF